MIEKERLKELKKNQNQIVIEELNNVLLVIDEIDKFDTVKGTNIIVYINERIKELKGK